MAGTTQGVEQSIQSLRKSGEEHGIFNGDIETAMSAFLDALRLLDSFKVEEDVNKNFLHAKILYDVAEMKSMLREWDDAYNMFREALEVLERNCFVNADNMKKSLLLLDIYRGLSISDSQRNKTYEEMNTWDMKALSLLRQFEIKKPSDNEEDDSQLQYLKATFLNHQSIGEDPHKQLSLYAEAIKILREVIAKFPNNLYFKQRLAHLYRNQGLTFKTLRKLEESRNAIERAIVICTDLILQKPMAPIFYNELYRAYHALVGCLEARPEIKHINSHESCLLAANEGAAKALSRLVEILPSVSRYWNCLVDILLNISELFEKSNEPKKELATLVRARECAEKSVNLLRTSDSDKDDANNTKKADLLVHQYDLVRVLLCHANFLYKNKQYEKSLSLYDHVHEIYTESILCHPDCMKEGDFYMDKCARALRNAYDCAKQADVIHRAEFFITQAVEVGRKMTSRIHKQYQATSLHTLGCLHLEYKRYQDAMKCFQETLSFIEPLHKQYPWHYFLITSYASSHDGLAQVYQALGDKESEIQHRRIFLKAHADLHGNDVMKWWGEVATLIPTAGCNHANDIHNNTTVCVKDDDHQGEQHFSVNLEKLRDKCKWNNLPPTKVFTLRCFFPQNNGGTFQDYSVYITSGIPGKDPLENQARILKEDSAGVIPLNCRIAFRKLHALALKNTVSFQELCAYAFDENNHKEDTPKSNGKDENKSQHRHHGGTLGRDECCICMEVLGVDDSDTLSCGHGYHYNCILQWADRNSFCPLCRTAL